MGKKERRANQDDTRRKEPLSLQPLTFEEALRGLLQTKPPPEKKRRGRKGQGKAQDANE